MKIELSAADLRPVIEEIAAEVVARVGHVAKDQRLAFDEGEAARLIGVAKHVLRDCRLRGEIQAARVGKKNLYRREDLAAFLAKRIGNR